MLVIIPLLKVFPALAVVMLAAACGGDPSLPPPPPPPPPPVTIADPVSYMAQSRNPDGNTATPLRALDPITYRRFDFGHEQASDSFLTSPTASVTTWGYSPWGAYVHANGDGGENYELQGNAVRILSTRHGGIETTALVPAWTVLTTSTVNCADGWTDYSFFERGCRATVNYPHLGQIDTVISEHRHPFENTMERIFLARGYGRLTWQGFRSPGTPADPSRCLDFGWNAYASGWTLTDCRVTVNIEPANGSLTGSQLWHP